MNSFSTSSKGSQKSCWKKFLFLFFVLCILGIALGPKALSKLRIWQETRRIQQYREQLLDIVPEHFEQAIPKESVIPQKSISFKQRLENIDVEELPLEKILDVPYICQNPYRNESGWDFHDNSCEEAALLQAYLFFSGEIVSAEEADQIIRDMITWQEKPENFGGHIDLYGEDMKQFIEGYYNLSEDQVFHIQNIDADAIRKIIFLGYPIIVPIKGELLNNPFYPYPGYHMLTIIGYSQDVVITNDVGTKRGEQYPYEWERFLSANRPVGNDALVILSISK